MPKDIEALAGADQTDFVAAMRGYLKLPKYEVSLYLNANQSIANSTVTVISWTAELSDVGGLVTVPLTFVTVPAGVTEVRATLQTSWAVNGTGVRNSEVILANSGGSRTRYLALDQRVTTGGETHGGCTSLWEPCSANDRVYAYVFQSSGGALNLTGHANADAYPARTKLLVEFR